MLPPLHTWPGPYRKLIAAFVAVMVTGFVLGTIFIEVTTHMTPEGVVAQYKGHTKKQAKTAEAMKFPKSAKEMLNITHTHILGLSMMFLILGFLYLHTGRRSTLRLAIAVEPLFTLILTFGGLWVVRYVWEPFVYVVIVSGVLMVGTVAWMGYRICGSCLAGDTYQSAQKVA
ncbi:MAG: hypothetical protein ABEK84_06660 [Salinibacter sp.]